MGFVSPFSFSGDFDVFHAGRTKALSPSECVLTPKSGVLHSLTVGDATYCSRWQSTSVFSAVDRPLFLGYVVRGFGRSLVKPRGAE